MDLSQFEKIILKDALDKVKKETQDVLNNGKELNKIPNKDAIISSLQYKLQVLEQLMARLKLNETKAP